jgi:hypothetical protein
MGTLEACLPGSPGNQEALVQLGGVRLMYALLNARDHTQAGSGQLLGSF